VFGDHVLALIVLVATVVYLSLAQGVHELGHLIGGRVAGLRPELFVLGQGSPVLTLRNRAPRIVLRALFFLGGYSVVDSAAVEIPTRARVLQLAGGPAADAAIGTLLFGAAYWTDVPWLYGLALLQWAVVAGNLIPLRLRFGTPAMVSDGAELLALWRGRAAHLDADTLAQDARVLRSLGAEAAAQRDLATAARVAAQDGALEQATTLRAEVGAPLDRTRGVLCEIADAHVAIGRGQRERAADHLAEATRLASGLDGAADLLVEAQRALAANAAQAR